MMKKLYKRLIIGTLLLTMGISISARIVAVNSSLNTTVSKIEESNKTFECNGIRMCISNHKIYDGEELNKLYDNELEDVVDNYDILFNISLENTSHDIKQYNAVSSGIMYGYNSGGSVNPYLYQYFNQDSDGILVLKSGEKRTITLAFPYEEYNSEIMYVVSLYPENIRIRLR